MHKIRKTKTASGSTAVQVVYYHNRKVVVEKHIGSGQSKSEIQVLVEKAREWIEQNTQQGELFPEGRKSLVEISEIQLLGATHKFAYQIFEKVVILCGLQLPKDRFLFDFAIMRIIEPTSKLRAITLLSRYYGIKYSERSVYRKMSELVEEKHRIESIAVNCARQLLQDDLSLVLYDVTTLYFETFKGDELRKEGFSKDNKPQQPQVVIGLLVTRQGFPLGYEVFAGNTFEGKTMLGIIRNFIKKHNVNKPVIVADAAMLSHKNITELTQEGLYYIVGARLGNAPREVITNAFDKLRQQDGASLRLSTDIGSLIMEFSSKRYRKDRFEMEKQIERAKQVVANKQAGKNIKFVVHKTKTRQYKLNEPLIEKTKLLLGMKGYYTNIPEDVMGNKEIIARYHDLWHVEHSFRIAKSDLASRPVFHYKQNAITSHILICFTALMIAKYMELKTNLPLRQITDAIWEINEVCLLNSATGLSFTVRSALNPTAAFIADCF